MLDKGYLFLDMSCAVWLSAFAFTETEKKEEEDVKVFFLSDGEQI